MAKTDYLIDQDLAALLAKVPGAARAQLGVIHNGVTGITGIGLLRFDTTNGAAAPGRAIGERAQNEPLADWNGYLSTLLAGHSATGGTRKTRPRQGSARAWRGSAPSSGWSAR